MKNQCAGCQADWPVERSKYSKGIIHLVQGGYKHEVMGCTSDRYGHYRCSQCLTFMDILERIGGGGMSGRTLYKCRTCGDFMDIADTPY